MENVVSISDEFLIICKHCKDILPSFHDFLKHKLEKHSERGFETTAQAQAADKADKIECSGKGEDTYDTPLTEEEEACPPRNQLIKIKFPFTKPTTVKFDLGGVSDGVKDEDQDLSSPLIPTQFSSAPINGNELSTVGSDQLTKGIISSDIKSKLSLKIRGRKKGRKRKQWSLSGHRCSHCAEIFDTFNEKRRHEWIHTRPFECSICYKGFPSKGAVRLHENKVHGEKSKEKTQKKKTQASNKDISRNAIPARSPTRKLYKCGDCPYESMSSNKYYLHKKLRHNAANPHKCPECTCSYTSGRGLNRHVGTAHPDSEHRKNYLLTNPNSNTKTKTHNPDNPHKCPECTCSYASGRGLNRHIGIAHPESEHRKNYLLTNPHSNTKMRPCSVCSIPITWNRMHSHRKLAHPEVFQFECPDCLHTAPSRKIMSRHRHHHFLQLSAKCLHCTASYQTARGCNIHILQAHPGSELLSTSALETKVKADEKSPRVGNKVSQVFKCKYCGKEQNCASHLKNHEGTHTLPFHCPHCPRRFSNKYNHKNHVAKAHKLRVLSKSVRARGNPGQAAKDISCPACQETLKGRLKLSQHLKIYHPSFKAYKCQECPFATASQNVISVHALCHRGGNEYPCPHCTAAFARLTSRDNHVIQVHPGLSTTPEIVTERQPRRASVHPAGYYNRIEEPLPLDCLHMRNPQCYKCDTFCQGIGNYERHFQEKHPGFKPYKCKDCHFSTVSVHTLENHEKLHVEDNEFKCDSCTASFVTRLARSFHNLSVHSVKGEGTDGVSIHETSLPLEADSSTPGENSIESDSKILTDVLMKDVVQPTVEQMQNAAIQSSPPLKLTCNVCFKNFPFNIALNLHQEKFHSGNQEGQGLTKEVEPIGDVPSVELPNEQPTPKVKEMNTSTNPWSRLSENPSLLRSLRNVCVSLTRIDGITKISKRPADENWSSPPAELPTSADMGAPLDTLEQKFTEIRNIPLRMRTRKSTAAARGLDDIGPSPTKVRRLEHKVRVFVCTTCDERFGVKSDLENHAAGSNCAKIGIKRPNQSVVIQKAVDIVTPVPPAVASKEAEMFKEKEVDVGDEGTVEKAIVVKPLCHICNTAFAFPGHLKTHMKNAHSVERPTKNFTN